MFWGQIDVGKFEFGCKGKVTFLVNFCSLITRWVTCGLDGDLYLSLTATLNCNVQTFDCYVGWFSWEFI